MHWAGADSVLGQNCVVTVNLRLICGESETACCVMEAAWRKAWTKSGGSGCKI